MKDFEGLIDRLIEHESAEDLQGEREIELFQSLINSGEAWRLQGSYGRDAMAMIEAGLCMLGEVGHTDYYGNYVPSRHEVKAGTKGSPEYVETHGASC